MLKVWKRFFSCFYLYLSHYKIWWNLHDITYFFLPSCLCILLRSYCFCVPVACLYSWYTPRFLINQTIAKAKTYLYGSNERIEVSLTSRHFRRIEVRHFMTYKDFVNLKQNLYVPNCNIILNRIVIHNILE